MPAAVAIPAIAAIVGTGAQIYSDRKGRQAAEKQAADRGVDPVEQARVRAMLDQWQQGGYSPEQLMQFLGQAPGGGQIGAAPTADISPYINTNWGEVGRMQQRTPQELQALLKMLTTGDASMGQAGELGKISIPQLSMVADYNKKILGGSKSEAARAIAPEAEALAEQQQGSRRAIEASGLRGGARDMALAESMRTAHGQSAGLIPSAIRDARGSAQALGSTTAGLQQGALGQAANIFGTAEGAERSNRQFGIGAEQANRQIGLQGVLGLLNAQLQGRGQDMGWASGLLQAIQSGRGQDLQAILGRMGIDSQRMGQVDSNYYQGQQNRNQMFQGIGTGAAGFWNLYNQSKKPSPTYGGWGDTGGA